MSESAINEELAAQLKLAKRQSRYFLLVAKTAKVGKLLLSKKRIKPAQIKQLKAETGGKKVFIGTCRGGGGVSMIFELTEEGPGNGDLLLKKLIKEDAGLKMAPEIRVVDTLAEVDEGEEEGDGKDKQDGKGKKSGEGEAVSQGNDAPETGDTAQPPAAAAAVDQLAAALGKLKPVIAKTLAAQPARKTEILGQVAEVTQAIKAQDVVAAKQKLLELGKLCKDKGKEQGQDKGKDQDQVRDDSKESTKKNRIPINEPDLIDADTTNACSGLLGRADLICKFYIHPATSRPASKLEGEVNACKTRINNGIRKLVGEVKQKQQDEKNGNNKAVYEAAKLVKACVKEIDNHLGLMRGNMRKAVGGEDVMTVGTCMFRGRYGIWLEKDAFKTVLVDYGDLPGTMKSSEDLVKAGRLIKDKSKQERKDHAQLMKQLKPWDPTNDSQLEKSRVSFTGYQKLLDNYLASISGASGDEGSIAKYVKTHREIPNAKQAEKTLRTIQTMGKKMVKDLGQWQAAMEKLQATLIAPEKHDLTGVPKDVASFSGLDKEAGDLAKSCDTLAGLLKQAETARKKQGA